MNLKVLIFDDFSLYTEVYYFDLLLILNKLV